MKNAPTFEFPIFLTKRQYLRGKIRARTTVVQIATIRGLKNVEKRRLYLYGLSVKKKKKKIVWNLLLLEIQFHHSIPNSKIIRIIQLFAKDEMRRKEEISSTRLSFFTAFFSRGKGSNGFCDVFPLYPFLRVMILNICTSNDKNWTSVCCCTLTMEIYIHVNCFYIACDFSIEN